MGANTSQQQDWNIRPHLTEAWQAASPRSSLPQVDTSKLGLQRCHSDLGNRGRWPIVMKPVLLDCTKGINSACFAKADSLSGRREVSAGWSTPNWSFVVEARSRVMMGITVTVTWREADSGK